MLSALLLCSIVGIADGDTVTARCKTDGTFTTIRVRLAEIDAPENAQPFGRRSKQHRYRSTAAKLRVRRQAELAHPARTT